MEVLDINRELLGKEWIISVKKKTKKPLTQGGKHDVIFTLSTGKAPKTIALLLHVFNFTRVSALHGKHAKEEKKKMSGHAK